MSDYFELNNVFTKFWNDRKPKQKHRSLQFAYYLETLEKLIQAFDYDNTPDGVDTNFLEMYLQLNGTACIAKSKVNDGYVAFYGGYCGNINEYGIGESYVGATVGNSYEGVIDTDLIVGINNSLRTGRTNLLDRYSGLLANIEESISVGIVNSRMLPIIECKDDKDIEQVKSISNQLKSGELCAISSKQLNIFDEENKASLNKLELFTSADISKLQYYSRFYEDTLKRLWIESGVEITNKDKSAQVNSDELESYRTYSRITIEDMLKCREKMCNDFNKLYGGNWSVKLNHNFDNMITKEDGTIADDIEGGEDNGNNTDVE